jgi:hypothetical protein
VRLPCSYISQSKRMRVSIGLKSTPGSGRDSRGRTRPGRTVYLQPCGHNARNFGSQRRCLVSIPAPPSSPRSCPAPSARS